MNRFYNHIKHFADRKDIGKRRRRRIGLFRIRQGVKHDANQLDDEQHHTGFDYYEYDMPKFVIPS